MGVNVPCRATVRQAPAVQTDDETGSVLSVLFPSATTSC